MGSSFYLSSGAGFLSKKPPITAIIRHLTRLNIPSLLPVVVPFTTVKIRVVLGRWRLASTLVEATKMISLQTLFLPPHGRLNG